MNNEIKQTRERERIVQKLYEWNNSKFNGHKTMLLFFVWWKVMVEERMLESEWSVCVRESGKETK